MGIRGPKSTAALTLVGSTSPVELIERPRAPVDLSDDEAEVWSSVVEAEAADWFRPSQLPLLRQYCRHVVDARRVAQLITTEVGNEQLNVGTYAELLKMQERESRAIAMLATKMRLAQQSTYDKSKSKPTLVKRPWEGS